MAMADDGGVYDVAPCQGIIVEVASSGSGYFGGNPRSGSPGSDDDGVHSIALPLGGIILEQVMAGGDMRRSGVASTIGPTADHGDMALRSFGDGRVWMYTCRMVALSDAVVALMAGQARSMRQFLL
ncbi:Kinesin-4 [Hordeum vulgare]|nr:Kinesin-4 [Hordeum vulgare]